MAEPTSPSRAHFGATAALGVAAAALAAVAAAKPWFRLASDRPASLGLSGSQTTIDMPLALALSLVVLAGWGAVLVLRGTVRRVAAAVALAAALGVLASVVRAPFVLPDELRDTLGPGAADVGTDPTGWYVATAVAAALCVLTLAEAWRRAPAWPTMSSRYDAPTTRPAAADETDLWQALDEGRDPTDPAGPASP